jgi:hypothetical protein
MSEQQRTFVAQKKSRFGWEVDVLWPDCETEVIKGFVTEYDAVKWIAEHSEVWRGADRILRVNYRE